MSKRMIAWLCTHIKAIFKKKAKAKCVECGASAEQEFYWVGTNRNFCELCDVHAKEYWERLKPHVNSGEIAFRCGAIGSMGEEFRVK